MKTRITLSGAELFEIVKSYLGQKGLRVLDDADTHGELEFNCEFIPEYQKVELSTAYGEFPNEPKPAPGHYENMPYAFAVVRESENINGYLALCLSYDEALKSFSQFIKYNPRDTLFLMQYAAIATLERTPRKQTP